MSKLKIDYSASVDIILSTDALYMLFFDEQPLDDISTEINNLQSLYPNGLELCSYELIPDDYRAVVTVAPYIIDDFQADIYLNLTKYITCEAYIEDGIVNFRFVTNRENIINYGEVKQAKLRISEYGFKYFSFNDDDKTMMYLKDFKKATT